MEITRKFEFDAGHRLIKHAGKCRNYHGHSYKCELTFKSQTLQDGMVIDFGLVKSTFGHFLDSEYDHVMILEQGDPLIDTLDAMGCAVKVVPFAPTAENLANEFIQVANRLFAHSGLSVQKVRLYETPNCWAERVWGDV